MISILYYDRDPAWREQAERWLSRDGAIEAVPAGTFDEAVTLFREREFDAVVADPLEDEVPGTLSIVRTHEPPIPFILLMEPGHEQVVIQALNSGADRYVEKSGDPAQRLGALAGAIEEMVAKEPESAALQRRTEELEFLSRTAMDFIRMGDEEDIYRYIAEQVYDLVRECYVGILLFDRDTRLFTFRNLIAGELARRIVREESGFDLEGISLPLDEVPSVEPVLGCDRLVEVITSLYQSLFKALPEEACNRIEERTDAGKYYSMGFNCRDGLYGVLTIVVRKGGELARRGLIEAFVRQASVALLRQHVRARLRESEARYRAVVESQRESDLPVRARRHPSLRERSLLSVLRARSRGGSRREVSLRGPGERAGRAPCVLRPVLSGIAGRYDRAPGPQSRRIDPLAAVAQSGVLRPDGHPHRVPVGRP